MQCAVCTFARRHHATAVFQLGTSSWFLFIGHSKPCYDGHQNFDDQLVENGAGNNDRLLPYTQNNESPAGCGDFGVHAIRIRFRCFFKLTKPWIWLTDSVRHEARGFIDEKNIGVKHLESFEMFYSDIFRVETLSRIFS